MVSYLVVLNTGTENQTTRKLNICLKRYPLWRPKLTYSSCVYIWIVVSLIPRQHTQFLWNLLKPAINLIFLSYNSLSPPPQVSLLYRLIQYITYITFKKSSCKFSFFLCYLFIFIAITEFCGYRFLFSKFPQCTYCCANSCHDKF